MKSIVIAISLLLSSNMLFAQTAYEQLLEKAYGAADTIYDGKRSLNQDQISSLDNLYVEIQSILSGDISDECSDPATTYKLAYKWAYDTWRSTGKSTTFAENVSGRCLGQIYFETYKQSYEWAYNTWRSIGTSQTFAAKLAEYEKHGLEKLSCYKDAYTWAYDTWRSIGKSKAHAERLCLKD